MSIYSEYEIKRRTNDFPQHLEAASHLSDTTILPEGPSDKFQAVFDMCSQNRWEDVERRYGKESLKEVVSTQGRSLLLEALNAKNVDLVKQLIERKLSVHNTDLEGNTPLHYAARIRNLPLFQMLSSEHWNAAPNRKEETLLHIAAECGNDKVIPELIKNGVLVNSQANYKLRSEDQEKDAIPLTPLHLAIKNGHVDCVDLLMSTSDSEYVRSRIDYKIHIGLIGHVLHFAIHFGQLEIVKLLLTKYWEKTKELVDTTNPSGETPLMYAAYRGELGIMDFLIRSKNASLEALDSKGRTALHHAALGGQRGAIDLLYHHISTLPEPSRHLQSLDGKQNTPLNLLTEKTDQASRRLEAHFRNLVQRPISHFPCPSLYPVPEFENLAIQGGGPPGIAYIGAAQAFERLGNDPKDFMERIKRISGTSAGAIYGTLMAFGYTADEMERKLKEKDLTEFLDHGFLSIKNVISLMKKIYGGIALQGFQNLKNLWSKDSKESWEKSPGLCSGENFREWMDKCIEDRCGIKHCTFGDLRRMIEKGKPLKHLHVFTSSLLPSEVLHINSEDEQWDNIIISDAIRASMSIPGMFRPHMLHSKDAQGMRKPEPKYGLQMDGGLTHNFPVEAFDQRKYLNKCDSKTGELHVVNPRTLGLSLYSPSAEQQANDYSLEKMDTLEQVFAFVRFYYYTEVSTKKKVHQNALRTILISNQDVKLWEFDVTPEKQKKLCEGALDAVLSHFNKLKYIENMTNASDIRARRICEALRLPLPTFQGRESCLSSLAQKLLKDDKSIHQVMLLAPEGFGKTETAVVFANKHIGDFSFVKWIDSETSESRKRGYYELASHLDIPCNGLEDLQTIQKKVYRELAVLPQDKPFLLIFDNVDENIELPKTGNGAVLITTKYDTVCKFAEVVKMELFSSEEALNALQKTTNRPLSADMEQLADELGGFPLAIGQLGTYIAENDVVISDFTRHLRQHSAKALDKTPTRFAYRSSLNSALKMTGEKLHQNWPEAYSWLTLCCFLESDGIPMEWIDRWLKEKLVQDFELFSRKTAIISQLSKCGIITCDMSREMISIHRLNKTTIHEALSTEERICAAQAACKLVLYIGEKFDYQHPLVWPALEIWEKHAKKLLKIPEIKAKDQSGIHTILGIWAKERGDFQTAEMELTKALEIQEGERKDRAEALEIQEDERKDRAERVFIMNHLVDVFKQCGARTKAMDQVVKIASMVEDSSIHHADKMKLEVLKYFIHVGELRCKYEDLTKDPEQSLDIYEMVLIDCEKKPGSIPLEIHAKILDKIGAFLFESRHLYSSGRIFSFQSRTLDDARKKHEEALQMYKQLHPDELHPTIAQNYEYQSLVLQALGLERAEDILQKAISMKEKLYGNRVHPSVISIYRVAAIFYKKLDVDKAISYCKKARILQEALSIESLEMAELYFLMGTLLRSTAKKQEAMEDLSRAVKLFEDLLGPEHPKTIKAKAKLEQHKSLKSRKIKIMGMKVAKFVAATSVSSVIFAFAASKVKGIFDHNKKLEQQLQNAKEELIKSQKVAEAAKAQAKVSGSITELAVATLVVGAAAVGCTIQ